MDDCGWDFHGLTIAIQRRRLSTARKSPKSTSRHSFIVQRLVTVVYAAMKWMELDSLCYSLSETAVSVARSQVVSRFCAIRNTVAVLGEEFLVLHLDEFALSHSDIHRLVISRNIATLSMSCFSSIGSLCCAAFESGAAPTGLAAHGFSSCRSLKCIFIPKTIEIIDRNSFWFCFSLRSITFESGSVLHAIGETAFEGCDLLSVALPASLRSLHAECFSQCAALGLLLFDPHCQIRELPRRCFNECSHLATLCIPDSVETIGEGCFRNGSVRRLSFASNSALREVKDGAFSRQDNLETVELPSSVEIIGEAAFSASNRLESIIFESGSKLTQIGSYAFAWCDVLRFVVFPPSIVQVGRGCFDQCLCLQFVAFESPQSFLRVKAGFDPLNILQALASDSPLRWFPGFAIQIRDTDDIIEIEHCESQIDREARVLTIAADADAPRS
jgi:hypothetical protein